MPNHPEWEDSMGALIDVISLFAILSNALFALHLWSRVSASLNARS